MPDITTDALRARRRLTRAQSYWVAAAIAAVALWTSAAPSLTYPLYESTWGLNEVETTTIFAIYPIVLVIMLVFFGNLSEFIGVRATILLGLSASLAGVVLFAVAPNVGWVYMGRGLMGVGVALSLSPATAAAIIFSAPGKADLARSTTTAATAIGYGLAVVVGGALVQYAPFPLHLNFWVLSAFIAVVIVCTAFLPDTAEPLGRRAWRPTGFTFPRGQRKLVAVGAAALASAYVVAVINISLGAQIAQHLIGSNNQLVNGVIIGLNALAVGSTAILSRNVPARTSVIAGAVLNVAGLAVILGASGAKSLPLLLISAVVLGAGYSLMFSGGLGIIGSTPLIDERAGMFSAAYLVAYFAQGVAAISLGAVATSQSLQRALTDGAVAIAAFCVATAIASLLVLKRSPKVIR